MSASPYPDLEPITDSLKQAYTAIWHRQMQDVPVVNPKLTVETVGFQLWQGFYLGVLITPWFMNLVLLPQKQSDWTTRHTGEKFMYAFAAGEFEFILAHIEGIGPMLTCSLFSPMFEFDDHDVAVATANAVILAIFDENNQDTDTAQSLEPPAAEEPDSQPTLKTDALSRRDFFRGKFLASTRETHKMQQ